jgi:peptidyl-Asp metalloendopeptidase
MTAFQTSSLPVGDHAPVRGESGKRPSRLVLAFHRLNRFALVLLMLLAGIQVQAQAAGGPPALLGPASRSEVARFNQNIQPAEPGVLRNKPVSINLQSLDPATVSPSAQLRVDIFDGQSVTLSLDRSDQRDAANYTWYGKVQGFPRGYAILTVVDGNIAATIDLGETSPGRAAKYQIQTRSDGLTALRQIDPNSFPSDHPPGAENTKAPAATKASAFDTTGDSTYATAALIAAQTADTGATIDVMVIYSNQTATAAGSAIGAQIQQAVDTANLVYTNSGITTRLRLVYNGQLNYNETGNIDTDLQSLPSNSTVGSLRNTYGADLVVMLTEGGGYCGSSYLGPSSSYAFAVVNRGCASSNYSFPHEIGHLFGARHDVYVDASTSPYAYGHGYVNCTQGWRDVMAYPSQCGGTRIAYLSNPNLTYGSPPYPLGTTTTADNVRVHNGNAVTVANFRLAATGGCTYALSPGNANIGASGGSGSFSVTAGAGCAWNTTVGASWLTVGAGSGTTANGTLNYTVAANVGTARIGTITVGGKAFTVNQATGCTFTLSPSSASFAAAGGSGTTTLSAGAGCAWNASSSASWLTVSTATSGTGSATILFAAAANTGATRSANLTIGGTTLVVTQAAGGTSSPATAVLSTSLLQLGNVQVGKASRSKGATLTNSGGGTLTIGSLAAGGNNPGDFKRTSGTCAVNMALTTGQSCTVYYSFSPTAKGARSGTLAIGTNGGTVTLTLSGTGK